jgi:ATP-dependent RNA helicase RhlB
MKFEDLEIHELLKDAIQKIGYKELTPIQERAIPAGLTGKDVTGLAQTGTGKTISFLIPIIHTLYTEKPDDGPIALILAPTRELVLQISEEAKKLLVNSDFKVSCIIGGTGYKEQEKEIQDKTEIIVATPGRLIDHIKNGNLKLSKIKFFVLDEADRMFDMGFIKDIRYVMKKCPDEKQVMLFSATLSYYVLRLASEYLRDPIEIRIEPEKIVTENIDQKIVHLGRDEKKPFLINCIRKENIEGLGIIFTNLKLLVPELVSMLNKAGITATGISSMLDQKKRIQLLKDFKLGKYKFLVATDVASRGIDVENIDLVINYDLPSDIENYVHRIGRTARAGKMGKSISFCSERDYTELEKIEKYLGTKIAVLHVEEEMLMLSDDLKKELEKDSSQKHYKKDHKGKEHNQKYKKDTYKKRTKDKTPSKPVKNTLEEAMDLIQKADSVLVKEKGLVDKKEKNQKFSKDRKNNHKKDKQKVFDSFAKDEKEKKIYDKSKRNLFDAEDYNNQPVKKRSIWKRIKSFFGF